MSSAVSSRRACDRCHAVKERCQWDVNKPVCLRCARLKHDCHLRRPQQKVGRKSRGRKLLDYSFYQSSRRSSESVTSPDIGSSPSARSSTQSFGEVSTPDYSNLPQSSYSPPREVALFGCLTPLEKDVLQHCFGAQEAVGRYTIGPSFHSRHQRALMTQLFSAFPQLKDAFLSCAPVLASQHNARLPENMEKFCYSRAATAISSLRSLQVESRYDVPISLALGVAVLTFGIGVSGGETFTLARFALGLIRPYYEMDIALDSDETSYLICLVLAETIGCLYRGEIPTLRFRCNEMNDSVDRYLGVSYPLLTQLYDLCEINHKLCDSDGTDFAETMAALDSIDFLVQRWQPEYPVNFLERYDHEEVVNIQAQARSLRLAILLIAHRLRHPYGMEDEKAQFLAESVLAEIELAMQLTEHPVKCTDLCLMAASLEQVDEVSRLNAINLVDRLLHFSRNFREMIKGHLKIFWAARDSANGIYWFHLNRYWHGDLAH